MDAVVPGNAGGVAMPVAPGPTAARGDPDAPAGAPAGDNVPFASRAADATEVDLLPRVLRQPSAAEMRAMYPESARRDGVEGDVRVEILVSAAGRVEEVRLVQPGGHGFDDVARTLVRRLAFVPAQRGGRPVPVWIPWTWKFRLDG
jgi:TonB family protein